MNNQSALINLINETGLHNVYNEIYNIDFEKSQYDVLNNLYTGNKKNTIKIINKIYKEPALPESQPTIYGGTYLFTESELSEWSDTETTELSPISSPKRDSTNYSDDDLVISEIAY